MPEEDGYFWIYENGVAIENSGISWIAQGLTAVYTGTELKISGVKDADGNDTTVTISLGEAVGSINFIPSRVNGSFSTYPTTDTDFLSISTYYSESEHDDDLFFTPMTNWDASNIVNLRYRINPSNAYVANTAIAAFIGRGITVSRADGDVESILQPVGEWQPVANGEISINAKINKSNLVSGKENIAALQLWNGQDVTTSDYVYVKYSSITASLVDSASMKANPTAGVKTFYNRTQAIVGSGETSAFIQQFCGLNAAANVQMVYNGSLDLSKLPGLYCESQTEWLVDLGFKTMTYEYSLPAAYNSNDAQGTNQQWFVQLDGSVLKANSANLTDGLTPAIGRTPVVRVDAFLQDNSGVKHMVGSAYIKVQIVQEAAATPDEKAPIVTTLATKEYEYHDLNASNTLINQMLWTDVNNAIYGKTGLSSNNFWNYYGGSNDEYTVAISVVDNNGNDRQLDSQTASANTPIVLTSEGVTCDATLGNGNTQTANITFSVNNNVKTQNTYKNVDGKGAEYTVTLTIKSDNNLSRGDVVIKQVFYVKEECKSYTYNPNFYAGSVDGRDNVVITKGKLVNGQWVLEMNISEVFEMINGQNIFSYFNTVNNASQIDFSLNPATQPGIKYTQTGTPATQGTIKLDAALTEDYKFASMKYVVTLVNGETCTFYFNVKFNNPFTSGTSAAITLDANATPGAQTADVRKSVNVVENGGTGTIYSWNGSALALSSLATGTYKVAAPTVTYEFVTPQNNTDPAYTAYANAYATFYGNLDINNGAQFGVGSTSGIVTYDNLGLNLMPTYNLMIKATVTFQDLSEVTCYIPFTVKGQNN